MKVGVIMKKSIIISFALCCLLLSGPVENLIFADQTEGVVSTQCNTLTQEQAKELLIKYNNKVDYIYQGTEDNFEALKSKNLHGYVFLPDADTDIGYYVDKESSQIYYFHPSGYLELVK